MQLRTDCCLTCLGFNMAEQYTMRAAAAAAAARCVWLWPSRVAQQTHVESTSPRKLCCTCNCHSYAVGSLLLSALPAAGHPPGAVRVSM
jgi:hypothetical protein